MNELVTVTNKQIGQDRKPAVYARDLHERLQSKKQFTDWIKHRIKAYGFIESVDFEKEITNNTKNPNEIKVSHQTVKNLGGRPDVDYLISLDMAKHLAMVERTEVGKIVRKYFIEVEKIHQNQLQSGNVETPRLKVIPTAEPVFKSLVSVARVFGLEDNQALLFANKATRRETGIDFQDVLQIELKNESQIRQFTATELGSRIGVSAIKFNKMLSDLGFQERRNDVWCATEKGKPFSVLLDVGKKHSDGTPIMQMKWLETVLKEVSKAA